MSLVVPMTVLRHCTTTYLANEYATKSRWSGDTSTIADQHLNNEAYADLLQAAEASGDKSFKRVVDSIIRSRSGDFSKSVPSLRAFPEMLAAYLRHHAIRGWLVRTHGERVEPFLVTDVVFSEGRNPDDKDSVVMKMVESGVLKERGGDDRRARGIHVQSKYWWGSEVTKKTIPDILAAAGYLVETEDLLAAYDEQHEHHREVMTTGFTEQYRYTGKPISASKAEADSWTDRIDPIYREGRKVIDVTDPSLLVFVDEHASKIHVDDEGEPNQMPVPMSHLVKVFDLTAQDFVTCHSADLERYVYDKSLATKLVLPTSHRHLLDILTTDIDTFTGDIIEGKSAGNVILAKGVPGVGKTLTAEVYSELIERPLYSIHSGSLGVTADSVRESLEAVFTRAKKWNAVLLLDESDVFVTARGTDITQNAIVAEFLRTMEYFDGLMFMTTNLAANIDEAILSRCAAIIDYPVPGRADAIRIWHVLATQFGTTLDDQFAEDLVVAFHKAVPRDVKMMLRLALRVAAHDKTDLTMETFEKVSTFRGVSFDDEAYHQHLADTGRLDEED